MCAVRAAERGAVPGRGAVPSDRGSDGDQRVGGTAPAQTLPVTGLTQGTVYSVCVPVVASIKSFNEYHYTEYIFKGVLGSFTPSVIANAATTLLIENNGYEQMSNIWSDITSVVTDPSRTLDRNGPEGS